MERFHAVFLFTLLSASAAVAQGLECRVEYGQQTSGQMGVPSEARVTLDEKGLSTDYTVTGGGCDFGANDGFGLLVKSIPIDDGFLCRSYPVNSNVAVSPRAYLIACKAGRPRGGSQNARVVSYGLGGDAVAVAKADTGAVPYSVRLCNRTPRGGMSVDLEKSMLTVASGACLEIDKPPRAFIRTLSQDVVVTASYALFKAGTFKSSSKIGAPSTVDDGSRIRPGKFRSVTVECAKPSPGEKIDPAYWGYCPMRDLKDAKNYRVCFDDGYSNQGDGLEWYGGGLRVVTNRDLMNMAPHNGQLSPFDYMSTAPGGCRDMFGVRNAWLLLADNKNNWNDQNISRVTYRYAEIPQP